MEIPYDEKKTNDYDHTIRRQFEKIVDLIEKFACSNSGFIEKKGQSFTVASDILLTDKISVRGVFSLPYYIKKSSGGYVVKRDSFFRKAIDGSSRIVTESDLIMELQLNDYEDQYEKLPVSLLCQVKSQTVFIERREDCLISKSKVFLEKIHSHQSILKKMEDGLKPGEVDYVRHNSHGFCKVDAATGYIMEEKEEI